MSCRWADNPGPGITSPGGLLHTYVHNRNFRMVFDRTSSYKIPPIRRRYSCQCSLKLWNGGIRFGTLLAPPVMLFLDVLVESGHNAHIGTTYPPVNT